MTIADAQKVLREKVEPQLRARCGRRHAQLQRHASDLKKALKTMASNFALAIAILLR